MKKILLVLAAISLLSFSSVSFNETKCEGETFDGSYREEAKTSIGSGDVENETILNLLKKLPKKNIYDLGDDSPRCKTEQRNVKLTCWLYTYAREGDEDFHLILGSSPTSKNRKFFSAEISGLPKDSNSIYYQPLNIAREHFKQRILKGEAYCGSFTKKYLSKPIPVIVTGSLFFDAGHKMGGSGTGIYRSKSAWEIHPVTDIEVIVESE